MFLLPISTTFRYLEQIFVNRMAPSMCSVRTPVERDEVVGFMQFCTIFPPHIWVYVVLHNVLKCRTKTDMPSERENKRTNGRIDGHTELSAANVSNNAVGNDTADFTETLNLK